MTELKRLQKQKRELELDIEKWENKLQDVFEQEPNNPDTQAYERWDDRCTKYTDKLDSLRDTLWQIEDQLENF